MARNENQGRIIAVGIKAFLITMCAALAVTLLRILISKIARGAKSRGP